MLSLYFLPHALMAALIALFSAAVLCQAVALVCGFFGFRYSRYDLSVSLLDAGILAHLFLLLLTVVSCNYHASNGLIAAETYSAARILIFLWLLTAGCLVFARDRSDILPLFTPAAAALTLPAAEAAAGRSFPILLIFALGLWLIHSARTITLCFHNRYHRLSVYSVKDAVDSLNFGLLLFRASGPARGQILICNLKMQELMRSLTGKQFFNGTIFYDTLLRGAILPDCRQAPPEALPAFLLPDGHIWEFRLQVLPVRKKSCALLTASDVTEARAATEKLFEQQQTLRQRNAELQDMLDNLEEACRSEELLRIKGRVHDLLGQRISLLLRSVLEHRKPDEALLATFANGLPEELKQSSAGHSYSLDMLSRDFESLGVRVLTEGRLPEEARAQKLLFEIAMEAVSNAVRHGCATEILVSLRRQTGSCTLTVTDNGLPKTGAVTEGGGFSGMRRKAASLGGSFAYQTTPHFTVTVTIPEENAL